MARYQVDFTSEDPELGELIAKSIQAHVRLIAHGHNGVELVKSGLVTATTIDKDPMVTSDAEKKAKKQAPVDADGDPIPPSEGEDPLAGILDDETPDLKDQMLDALRRLKAGKGNDWVLKILKKVGASNLNGIPEDKYEQIIATCDKLLADA